MTSEPALGLVEEGEQVLHEGEHVPQLELPSMLRSGAMRILLAPVLASGVQIRLQNIPRADYVHVFTWGGQKELAFLSVTPMPPRRNLLAPVTPEAWNCELKYQAFRECFALLLAHDEAATCR